MFIREKRPKKNTQLSEQVQNLIGKSEIGAKLIPLTHIYMTSHFPGLVQALQLKIMGLNYM